MRITTISYGRTLTDGNYGSFRADVTADLEGDNPQEAIDKLKEFVLANVNDQVGPSVADSFSPQQDMFKDTKEVVEVKKETAPEPKEEVVVAQEEKKPAKKKVTKKAAKKTAKKATKKTASVPYDRNLQPHKTMFLAMASELGLRDGVSPEDKKALKETSEFMEGKDMFEAGSTDILDSFKETASHQFKDFKKTFQAEV